MDDDTQDKLIDLYTRYGDQLTPAQAAEWGVTATADPMERHPARAPDSGT